MQDRLREAGLGGDCRIGMQRVHVGVPAIDQRHFGTRRQIADRVRRALRDGVRHRRGARRSAEAAVAAREGRLRDGGEQIAGRLVVHLALRNDQRALAGPLVDRVDHAGVARHRAGGWQRLVEHHVVLAVHDLHPVDAGVQFARPHPRLRHDGRKGRQDLRRVLQHERKLVLVHRVLPEAEAQRIEDRIALRIGALDVRNLQRHQLVVDDRHYTGSQLSTSPERSSGVNDCLKAFLSCASSFSTVQPSERCSTRIGRGCE